MTDPEQDPLVNALLDSYAAAATSSFIEAVNNMGMGYLRTFQILLTIDSITDPSFPGGRGENIPSNDDAWNQYHLPKAMRVMDLLIHAVQRLCSIDQGLDVMLDDESYEAIITTGMRWMRENTDKFYESMRTAMK